MKVKFNKPSADTLEIGLMPDELDAEVWPRTIWIRHAYIPKVSNTRLALIAYLLSREFVGNTLQYDGIACPAFLAAAAVNEFPGQELFLYPVTNVAERISPEFKLESIVIGSHSSDEAGCAKFERTELGYVVRSVTGQFEDIPIATNIDLFSTQLKEFPCAAEVAVFLSLFDGLSVRSLTLPEPEMRNESRAILRHLVSEVGARLNFIEATQTSASTS